MKIAKVEDLHCNAGWRDFSFLKITTDDGIVGWSEYNESYGSAGLTTSRRWMGQTLIGKDPRPTELISATLYATTRQAAGGINQQAIAAIENALLDVKAKDLGVPIYSLFGGPVRQELPLYWSPSAGMSRAAASGRSRPMFSGSISIRPRCIMPASPAAWGFPNSTPTR